MFKDKKILVTGGLGFIGSNLVMRLVNEGAQVTVVDSMIPEYGGNLFNINEIKDAIKVNYCDITDKNAMEWIVKDQDYIFHLAGQVSHLLSFTNPYNDIDYNITATVILLEACRKNNTTAKIIYTGTRGQYGSATHFPVTEESPTNPKGLYEITNLTAEKIFLVYNEMHGIKSVLTRLTNVYGPRAQMKTHKYGVANWFVRLAIDNESIPIYGDGLIKRDFIYVDDTVDALLQLALKEECFGQVFNIGSDYVSNFKELAEVIIDTTGQSKIEFTPFSEERRKQEPGDFYSDISKIYKYIGWKPKVSLREGISRTVDFYKKNKSYYW